MTSIRIGMLFISTPVFASVKIPAPAKVVLVIGLALAMSKGLNADGFSSINLSWLISVMISEVLIGAAIAATLIAGFASFSIGGRLLDFQIGYGISGLVDIATRSNMPLLGSLLSMTAVLIFFGLDGHWALLQVVKLSFDAIPIGSSIFDLNLAKLIAYFGSCFSFGFAVVAPVVLCLFLIDIGMAFMSRSMPQMNVFVMSLAIKVIVGLIVLAMSVPFAGGVVKQIFESIFNMLNHLLG
ncbi:MAG TPA: flagellar biosynthetic protein FliR [Methylotenera sp.]|nr:flagellar biosynthetic protein FliR [Methylotenera sp.]